VFDLLDGLVVVLVPHAASVPRSDWSGEESSRPLSAEGLRQAEGLAAAIGAPVAAVYSSSARRCVQTVEPLARARRVGVLVDADLTTPDDRYQPSAWTSGVFAPMAPVLGGASMAGKALAAIARMGGAHPAGRVVACSHGDVIPALLAFVVCLYDHPVPAHVDRGGWFEVRFQTGTVSVTAYSTY
jgi:8-oxo-dGTP diphosphatase